jgi:uncharacterized protein YqeY
MATGIETEFTNRMKTAMKAKDAKALAVLRSIRTNVQMATTAKGFSGEVNDALYLKIIAAYVKSLKGAITDFERGGDRAKDRIDALQFEVDYLDEFMPKLLGEAETRSIVEQAISDTGAANPKQVGQVMGYVMKSHKGKVDPGLVRRLAEGLLAD